MRPSPQSLPCVFNRGRPKVRASITLYAQRKPRLSRVSVICRIALPAPSCNINGTFSSMSHFGQVRRLARSRNTSATMPDFLPSIPCVFPAWLRSWQGKPAVIKSTLGNVLSLRTSSMSSMFGKRLRSTSCAPGSISQSNSVQWPAWDRPLSMPPIPAKRPTTLKPLGWDMLSGEGGWLLFIGFRPRSGVIVKRAAD